MKKLILTFSLLLVLFAVNLCQSQQDTTRISISRIKIIGNELLSTREIRNLFPSGNYTPEQIKAKIENLLVKYLDKKYYFTKIDVADSTGIFSLNINEGPRFFLNQIYLSCADTILQNFFRKQLDYRGRENIPEAIKSNAEKILHYLESNGYPFGNIKIDSLNIFQLNKKESEIDCYCSVFTGAFVTIDSVHIEGNSVTRDNVIIRESRLKTGTIYNYQKIGRLRERLLRTAYFRQVEEPVVAIDGSGRGHLSIKVKEGTPNQFNAVFGYYPGTRTGEKGYITGLIDINFDNLLGTGRVIKAFWRKKDSRSQELKFRYMEPWIMGYPVNAGFGFQQTIQDTSFVRRNWGINIDIPFSDILTIHSFLGKESVLPDSIGQLLYGLPESSSWLARIGFSYDTRNNILNPRRGMFYTTQFEYGDKRIISIPENAVDTGLEMGNFRRDRWTIDAELYVPTFRWQTMLFGLHGKQVKTAEKHISVADLFRVGGTGSLRGYREDEFLGDRIAWMNLEYRYLLADQSRAFVFVDGGYFSRKETNSKIVEDYKFSYGFGLRIETRLGIIGIDYGLGEGRGLTSGLVHIGLTNKF